MKRLLGAIAAIIALSGGAQAATTNLVVEGGGTAQIYSLDNGNLLGLWGIDNRNASATDITVTSFSDLIANFTMSSRDRIVNAYNGSNPINAGASEFDVLSYSFDVAAGARLVDSIWIEWTGGNLVYKKALGGGTNTMGTTVTLFGDPFAPEQPGPSVVPLPAGLPLLLAGLGGLGIVARRKSKRA